MESSIKTTVILSMTGEEALMLKALCQNSIPGDSFKMIELKESIFNALASSSVLSKIEQPPTVVPDEDIPF